MRTSTAAETALKAGVELMGHYMVGSLEAREPPAWLSEGVEKLFHALSGVPDAKPQPQEAPTKPAPKPKVVEGGQPPPKDTTRARLNVLFKALKWDSNMLIDWSREKYSCLPGDLTEEQRKEAIGLLEAELEAQQAQDGQGDGVEV